MKMKVLAGSVTALGAVVTLILLASPAPAQARIIYSAGNFQGSTTICSCPILYGECVCSYDTSKAPPAAPPPS
jgi:hypothetical protein